jgi:hypothetical protein
MASSQHHHQQAARPATTRKTASICRTVAIGTPNVNCDACTGGPHQTLRARGACQAADCPAAPRPIATGSRILQLESAVQCVAWRKAARCSMQGLSDVEWVVSDTNEGKKGNKRVHLHVLSLARESSAIASFCSSVRAVQQRDTASNSSQTPLSSLPSIYLL